MKQIMRRSMIERPAGWPQAQQCAMAWEEDASRSRIRPAVNSSTTHVRSSSMKPLEVTICQGGK